MDHKLFRIGLVTSFFIHAGMIAVLSLAPFFGGKWRKPARTMVVTYQDLKKEQMPERKAPVKDLKVVKDLKPSEPEKVKVLEKKENMFSSFGQRLMDISKFGGKVRVEKKSAHQMTPLDIGKKITISPVKAEKITNPKYLTYNDDMRDAISRNIKERAYTYIHHPDFQTGEVYVTFVLDSDGRLRQIKIIDDKTFANDYLRSVALKSIKESSPFPPFPKGFDYPEFTFNLLISFKD